MTPFTRRPFAAGAMAVLHLARLFGARGVCCDFDHPPFTLVNQGVDLHSSHSACFIR